MCRRIWHRRFPGFLDGADDARRARSWQTLRAMARLCYSIRSVEPPAVPSRAEIEENIRRFRATKQRSKGASANPSGGSVSMQPAFFEKLLETASMLGTIESYATNLAGKITAGDAGLSSLDLQSIGEDVLRQCSEEDMSQPANNIGSLLPALGSLQQTVQAQASAAGQPVPNLEALAGLGALAPPA